MRDVRRRGHDSPHRERSKIDAVVPQLQVDFGYMVTEALCRLRASLREWTLLLEPASATPLDGHDFSNFRTAVGKIIFMALWGPDMQFAIQQLSTQVLDPTTESTRAVKQLIRYLNGTQHTCLRLEPREVV